MAYSVIREQNNINNFVVSSFGIAGSKINKFGKGSINKVVLTFILLG